MSQADRADVAFTVGIKPSDRRAYARAVMQEFAPVLGFGGFGPAQQRFHFVAFPAAFVGVRSMVVEIPAFDVTVHRGIDVVLYVFTVFNSYVYRLLLHRTVLTFVQVLVWVLGVQSLLVHIVGGEGANLRPPGDVAVSAEEYGRQ